MSTIVFSNDANAFGHDPFAGPVLARAVPTTEAQREVWLADRLGREASLAYNESVSLYIDGALDVAAMEYALGAVANRHEALRMTFGSDGLDLMIAAEASLPLRHVDLSEATAAAQGETLSQLRAEAVEVEFDLSAGPLARATLVRLGPQRHELIFTAHHIVCDGWALGVLAKDLMALYRARADGTQAALPAPESYGDYALSLHDEEHLQAARADTDWWVGQYASGTPVLELPGDRPRPAVRRFESRREELVIEPVLVASIKALGARHGASLFATLFATFAALLARLSGENDVVVGVPASGQAAEGLPGLVGHCVQLLPIRVDADPQRPFGGLLGRARGIVLDAYEHQACTLGTLLRELRVARDPSRLPLVQVLFNLDAAIRNEDLSVADLRVHLRSNPRRYENFEIFLNACQNGDEIILECQYNTGLFDAETIRRWLGLYREALARATADTSLAGTALLRATLEDRALLDACNATAAGYEREANVPAYLSAGIGRNPGAVALVSEGGALTFAELRSRSNRLARALRARGIGRGTLVGLYVERGLDMVVAHQAVLKSGAAYVPLDPAYPADRLAYMAEDARLALLVSQSSLGGALAWPRETTLLLDADAAAIAAQADGDLEADDGRDARPEDPAYVIYTSGSTGKPKGVVVHHRAVVNFLASMAREPGLVEGDILVAVTTLSFDIAVLELMLPLAVGARIVLATREQVLDGQALKSLIEDSGATVVQATPASWRMLIDAGWKGAPAFKALIGGEGLPQDLAQQLMARTGALWNMYGPTETTVWSTCWKVEPGERGISIGRPIANTTVWVLDEQKAPCPIGVPGEIYIGGDGVTPGYLNRPELTAERFVPDPFAPGAKLYRTGDRGRWRHDGLLEHMGRLDFQVKVRGYRIELGEIEATLATHPQVARAVVIVREDQPGDVRLVAYLVGRGEVPAADALRTHLKASLPDYMLPQHFIGLESIPLLPNGKINRHALPLPDGDSIASASAFVAPETETERVVAETMARLLNASSVSVEESFFALGGHSLLAMRLVTQVGEALKVSVPLRVVFEAPSVRTMSRWIDAQRERPADDLGRVRHRDEQRRAPLSLMQARLWFLEQMRPGLPVNNEPSGHRLLGQIDERAFEAAFNEMIRRQAALRTVIGVEDGVAYQRVLDEAPARLFPAEDLSGMARDQANALVTRRMREMAAEIFDLHGGPLYRVHVFRVAPEEHVLFLMVHHLVWDGWSIDIFYQEMAALYGAFCRNQPAPLAPLRLTYADFAAWQEEWVTSAEMATQLTYWKGLLEGAIDPVEMPADSPRPAVQSGKGNVLWVDLPNAIADRVREVAKARGLTPFMVLFALYAAFIHQQTRRKDFVVGVPVRGRPEPDLERVMGFFVNALPMRVQLDPENSFLELLEQVHLASVEAMGHPDVPFEALVRALKLPRDESRFPIFQVYFSYQDGRGRPATWGNIEHRTNFVERSMAAWDVGLWFLDRREGMRGAIVYNSDIFSARTVEGFRDAFLNIMTNALSALDAPLARLIAPPTGHLERIQACNATAAGYEREANVPAYLSAGIGRNPGAVALVSEGGALTFAELRSRSNRLARALRARGIGRGTLVGLYVERGLDMVVAHQAVLKSGAAYVPLDPAYPADRLAYMAEDARLALLVSQSSLGGALAWPRETTLLLDADAAAIAAQADGDLEADDGRDARPEDPAYVIYTSGSTGKPKGVVVHHRAVVNFLASMAREPGLVEGDILVAVTTLSFDIAVLELMLPLAVGARIVLATREQVLDGQALKSLIEDSGATVVQATPASWRMLIDAGWKGAPAFKALIGGEGLPQDLAQQLMARTGALWNMYGPTETTVWSTCWKVEPGERGISIGRPIANTTVWVLDEQKAPCPIGVPGEIYIGGDGVTPGYLNRPELTAERFVPDPFAPGAKLYRTGDRGRWRHDGLLEHMGRLDFQVKVRGYRIELGEIEATLATHPQVARAVVIVREDQPGDVRLVAYLVGRGEVPAADALRTHLKASLPDYMLPQHFIGLESIPLLPNGKINRHALPLPDGDSIASASAFVAPETETERVVAEIWHSLLGASQIGVNVGFFEAGGHSMLAMRLMAQVERRFGQRIPLSAIIDAPTIRQLAGRIDRGIAGDSLVVIRRGEGNLPPVFIVHDGDGETLLYRNLANRLRRGHTVYGLQPCSGDGIAMRHTRIPEMAAYHIGKMCSVQAQGPYVVAGFCAGGVIAFEIARQLQAAGEIVAMVGLIDIPDVEAEPRRGREAGERLQRFAGAFSRNSEVPWMEQVTNTLGTVSKKMRNLIVYDFRTREQRKLATRRGEMLRAALDSGQAPPAEARALTVRETYFFARHSYVPVERYRGDVALFRATVGDGSQADTPCIEMYRDPLLGWETRVTGNVRVFDIPGGHSSMLQEPNAAVLASVFQRCIDDGLQACKAGSASSTHGEHTHERAAIASSTVR